MARRMGKAADDQYMGGGTGNWSRAPKKKTVAKRKPSGASRRTAEAVKKMKQKESSVPKPRKKPGSDSPKSGASRSTKGKVSPKSGASRSTKGKVSPKSGASRSTAGKKTDKVDNSVGARLRRGARRLFQGKDGGIPAAKASIKATFGSKSVAETANKELKKYRKTSRGSRRVR